MERVLDAPGSRMVALASADGTTVVHGVVAADGTGYLRASALPALPGGRTYQLWGRSAGRLVSLGVLGAEPGVVSFHDAGYDLLAITDEASPGVVTTANAPVVATA
jgi:hypothetical protein